MAHVQRLIALLEGAHGIYKDIDRATRPNATKRASRLVYRIKKTLNDLPIGEWFFLPSGYRRPDGGHAIMYLFLRSSADTFSMVVANTGSGLEYHPSSAEEYPKG